MSRTAVDYPARRVLHLIHSSQVRGAEVFASQLATRIQANGRFQNAVCSLFGGSDSLPIRGLPLFKLDGGSIELDRKMGLDPRAIGELLGVIRRFNPDILVAHGSVTLKYAAMARAFHWRATTVYRNIGTVGLWASPSVKTKLRGVILRSFDSVVSVSCHSRNAFINVYRYPPEKIVLIPNGVDHSPFDACNRNTVGREVREELGFSQQERVLVSVGNLSEEKGHVDLLAIMGDLQRAGLESRLLLVGDGPLRQELEQQARELGISSQVRFLGRRSDIPRVLAAADLMVLPSKTEGMPAVLIEAGLAGLPSVAFDVGGVGEVVDHGVTGLLAPPGDLLQLSNATLDLCRDPERRAAMGAAARRRCREMFAMDKVARQYEEHFTTILRNEPKPRGTTRDKDVV